MFEFREIGLTPQARMNTFTSNQRWGDIAYETDVQKDARFVNMSPEEWKHLVKHHLSACNDLKRAMAWIAHIESKRTCQEDPIEPEPDYATDLQLFEDMVSFPSKYGDDIEMTLDLEASLIKSPARWRVGAIWAREEDRHLAQAATKIQAIVRGMLARKRVNCGRCLAHVLCENNICIDCLAETEERCWDSWEEERLCEECGAPPDWKEPAECYARCSTCGAPTDWDNDCDEDEDAACRVHECYM